MPVCCPTKTNLSKKNCVHFFLLRAGHHGNHAAWPIADTLQKYHKDVGGSPRVRKQCTLFSCKYTLNKETVVS